MQRRFRGRLLHIEVKNPTGVCGGVKTLAVDGQLVAGCVIPVDLLKDGAKIVATLG